MLSPHVIRLATVDSTNSYLLRYEGQERMVVCVADYQTAGRGCGHNAWESRAGENLLLSVRYRPQGVAAAGQFVLSMAVAVALKAALDGPAGRVSIKWPNDIYLGDGKLCGTLIETTLRGAEVETIVAGTGINVNQTVFSGDAPNPVSLAMKLGHAVDREALLARVMENTQYYMAMAETDAARLRSLYRAALYRRSEWHPYRLPDGSVRLALLEDVADDGHLLLCHADTDGGEPVRHAYAFKEVAFVVDNKH